MQYCAAARSIVMIAIILCLSWGGAGAASAQETEGADTAPEVQSTNSQEATELPAIVVTATRVEADLKDIPMSVSVVGKQEIEERPGTNVSEQLVHSPGVSMSAGKTGSGNNSMISIRGLEAGRVLYLIDGIRQNSIFKEDMNKGLLNVDPDDIERVEIIKGPASSLYGSDAIGGVVNIITKKGGKGKPFGAKTSLVLDGSNTSIAPRLALYGDIGGWSYRLSGNYINANDRSVAGEDRADHSAYTAQSLLGQLGYSWDGGSINFQAQHYDSDVEEMTAIYSIEEKRMNLYDKDDPRVYYLSDFPRNRRDTYKTTLSLDNLTDNLLKFTANGFYQRRDTIQRGKDANGSTFASNRLQDLSDSYGGLLQADWVFFESHFVTTGVEYLYDKLTNYSIGSTGAPEYRFDATQRSIAVFIQDEWNITDTFSLTGGLRQSWIRTALSHFEADPGREDAASESSLVGNLGFVYKGFDNIALRAQYSQGFRTPDLASQFTGTGIYLEPNTKLKPEKSSNYEIGIRYDNGNLFVDSSIFYNRIDDAMTTRVLRYIPNTTWSVNETINAATYTAWGWELDFAWKIGETGFTPYGNLTLMRSELEHEKYTTRHNRTPEAWGSLGLKWEHTFDDGVRLFANLEYRASASYKFDGGDNTIWYKHKSGQTADASLGIEIGDEKKFKAILSVKNIFDEEYEPAYYYYPGVHAVLNLSYEF